MEAEAASRQAVREDASVRVVLFDDMKGSTVLKDRIAGRSDEEAFHVLRREHDELVTKVVTRDGAGQVIKSTARATGLAWDGHICVTRPVYTDAFSWIAKQKIAWKTHGAYRLKRGEPPLAPRCCWQPL